MRSKISTLLLSGLMIFSLALRPALAQSSTDEKLRDRVVEWGPNKVVAIELKSGQKLKGRIAEIRDDALTVQLLEQGKIETRALRWNELKKISLKPRTEDKVRKTGGFIALGVVVTLAVVIGVALSDPNF